jgi:hypothetical protein
MADDFTVYVISPRNFNATFTGNEDGVVTLDNGSLALKSDSEDAGIKLDNCWEEGHRGCYVFDFAIGSSDVSGPHSYIASFKTWRKDHYKEHHFRNIITEISEHIPPELKVNLA